MKKYIAIIGSGPSALMLAAMLDNAKYDVNIYERNFAVARKFLVAGDGGFNLQSIPFNSLVLWRSKT